MTGPDSMPRDGARVFGVADVPLPTARQAADADRRAREQYGVPERVLMESAGRAAALVLHRLYPAGPIIGVAGPGNNGGDLVVMLRVLGTWGREVALVVAGPRPPDEALYQGGSLDLLAGDRAVAAMSRAAVLVDGLLGTGAEGPPREWAAEWIRHLNAAGRPILSLDLPSGVDAGTGRVHEPAVSATSTVTFGWPKLGLLLNPARQRCGRLIAVEIGFPSQVAEAFDARAITQGWVRQRLRRRRPDAHKSSVGRLLVLAGSHGMAGAGAITVKAALRAGAGLIRVASHPANREILQATVPEATFLDREAVEPADVDSMHAIVAGPGLGQDYAADAALQRVLRLLPATPALLDADALNVLADRPDALARVGEERPLVITPHAKELARLTGQDLDEILDDMPGAARMAAGRFRCVVLLKGQPSLIAEPGGRLLVNTTGSSDVATAGMGDQLAGVIGAFLAGSEEPLVAAALGVYLSGRAADLCGMGRSLLPDDVSASMSTALADPGPAASPLDLPFVSFDQPARW